MTNDMYGRTVVLTSDDVNDSYLVTNADSTTLTVSFPTGTSQTIVYSAINSLSPPVSEQSLPLAMATAISNFTVAINQFIALRYAMDVRLNLIGIYINATLNSLPNRQAYIGTLLTWQNSVLVYSATYIATVQAQTSAAAVAALTWNFSTLSSTDPLVTAIAALQINS